MSYSYYNHQQQHGGSDWGVGNIGYDGHISSTSSSTSSYSRQSSSTASQQTTRRSVFHHRHISPARIISARSAVRHYEPAAACDTNSAIHHHKRYGGSDWGTGDIGYDGHVAEEVATITTAMSCSNSAATEDSAYSSSSPTRPSRSRGNSSRDCYYQPDAATKVAMRYARTMHDGSEWGSEDVGYDGHSAGIPAS